MAPSQRQRHSKHSVIGVCGVAWLLCLCCVCRTCVVCIVCAMCHCVHVLCAVCCVCYALCVVPPNWLQERLSRPTQIVTVSLLIDFVSWHVAPAASKNRHSHHQQPWHGIKLKLSHCCRNEKRQISICLLLRFYPCLKNGSLPNRLI